MSQLLQSIKNGTPAQDVEVGSGNQTSMDLSALPNKTDVQSKFAVSHPATGDGEFQRARFEPVGRSHTAPKSFNQGLLEKAEELLDNIESAEKDVSILKLESVRHVICELWNTSTYTSLQHQSLLALIEAFLAHIDLLQIEQAAALRGAFKDLAFPRLTEQHLDVIRSGLIDVGHNPLVAFSDISE